MDMILSEGAKRALSMLNSAGFEAYAVGGCVRDMLLGFRPHDFDVCTSALPEETLAVFRGERTFTVGIRHGTVGVFLCGETVEITTYRVDGAYSDLRHPDGVSFTRSLSDDLCRRDFTVNAMAYHPETGLCDPFGGREDLALHRIRCVGDPGKRFSEDGLRIMRALRFASVLGFSVETETGEALLRLCGLLARIAPERILSEWEKLLSGRCAFFVIRTYLPVFSAFLPGFDRLTSEACAVLSSEDCGVTLRFAAILRGMTGNDKTAAEVILRRLHCPAPSIRRLSALTALGGIPAPCDLYGLLRLLSAVGRGEDAIAAVRGMLEILSACGEDTSLSSALLSRVEREKLCFAVSGEYGLCVTGAELASCGIPEGRETGRMLALLLDRVTGGALPNERESLLRFAAEYKENRS